MKHAPPASADGDRASAIAQNADSRTISNLFAEIKDHVSLAEDDALRLEAYARLDISWHSHADRLMLAKEHANDLLRDCHEIARLRDQGSPRQQAAIDRLGPILKTMSEQLTATIRQKIENPRNTRSGAHVDQVRDDSEFTTRASSQIRDLVGYGGAKASSESIRRKERRSTETSP